MTTPGFGGKLLLVNLTNKEITALDTEKYEQFGGGHGIATALFWDYCVAPGDWDLQDAFHPNNMVALVTGPVSGTGPVFRDCHLSVIPYNGSGTAILAACSGPL
jgi:aldehyde:ferredoxin oxidoreductase